MAFPTTAQVLAKWKARAAAASQDYVAGAIATDKDPTALAIAAIPFMQQRFNDAVNSGRVANALRRAGRQGWLTGVETKGAQNYAVGVQNADAKFTAAFDVLLADEARGLAQLSTDRSTIAARRNRMTGWFDWMSAYKTRNP